METVKTVFSALGVGPSVLIGVFLGSTMMLSIKNRVGFPKEKVWIVWVVFVFSGSLLVGHGIVQAYNYGMNSWRLEVQKENLHKLVPMEKEFLAWYIDKETKTSFAYSPSDYSKGMLIGLEKKKIIYTAKEVKNRVGEGAYYNIEDWAYEYLKEHPELLQTDEK